MYINKRIPIYKELDLVREHRTQFLLAGRGELIAKVKIQNLAYLNQDTDIKIPHGLADHIICSDTVKITFVIDIVSTEKIRSIVNNAGIELVKKMIPIKRN